MSMGSVLKRQFGHPRGTLGRMAGWAMAHTGPNRERSRRTVQRLGLGAGTRVLEIGFGPGVAIEMAASIARDGLVAGVDVSDVMVRQARRRNARALSEGRVDLRRGSVTELPDFGAPFDVVFAVNTLHHWADPERGLGEILRLLRPGGMVAITEQPRSARARDSHTRERAASIADRLRGAGFVEVKVDLLPLKPVAAAFVTALRP